ncbi:hypothetical protein FPV67DRAFT_1684231 [Lyophyllum atratum]|nr:hypothetical protein FPV67DRAFT_1684231 [Lyophyllum atratum]
MRLPGDYRAIGVNVRLNGGGGGQEHDAGTNRKHISKNSNGKMVSRDRPSFTVKQITHDEGFQAPQYPTPSLSADTPRSLPAKLAFQTSLSEYPTSSAILAEIQMGTCGHFLIISTIYEVQPSIFEELFGRVQWRRMAYGLGGETDSHRVAYRASTGKEAFTALGPPLPQPPHLTVADFIYGHTFATLIWIRCQRMIIDSECVATTSYMRCDYKPTNVPCAEDRVQSIGMKCRRSSVSGCQGEYKCRATEHGEAVITTGPSLEVEVYCRVTIT